MNSALCTCEQGSNKMYLFSEPRCFRIPEGFKELQFRIVFREMARTEEIELQDSLCTAH